MKVPLSWLKEFVEITLPVEELARRLPLYGIEVASVTYIGVEGSELPWDADKILVANILEVKPHPNADRLVLAEVDYGGPQPHTVVTGAPNLYPYKGVGRLNHPLKAVFAREGSRLYDGHVEGKVITTLKGRPVRGVMSDAMLCSEKELGISEEHEGIIFLEDDAPVGMPLRDYLGEVVLEIELTPNYARCLSIVGLAREVAAITGSKLTLPVPQVHAEGQPIAGRAAVTIDEPDLCPRFTVGLIEGVTIGQSPGWMQRRLTHAGMRPINTIVDISNYVMLEWGQPTHAFDADKVQQRHLIVRNARPGERLTTLDGKDRELQIADFRLQNAEQPADDQSPISNLQSPSETRPVLCVCDQSGPLGIAGVMGGAESEVSDTTTNVLLEAAIWEPVQIRRVARALKLPSEASRRYERGVDYELPLLAQRRCLELMRMLAGGTVAQGLIDEYPRPWQTVTLELPAREVKRIVGIDLDAHTIADLLRTLGFTCLVHADTSRLGDLVSLARGPIVRVTVPSFRQDVTMVADLCEEVARIYSYEKVPPTRLADEIPAPDEHPDLVLEQRARDVLRGCGLNEIITYSLTSMAAVARVQPAEAVASRYLRLSNPSTPEREYMRRSLLPTVLEALATNLRERDSVQLFEIGRVYWPTDKVLAWQAEQTPAQTGALAADEVLPEEPRHVALALAGSRSGLSWLGGNDDESFDFFDLKGAVETLLARLGLSERVSFVPLTDDERFHPGRAAALLVQTQASGQAGGSGRNGGRMELLSQRVGVLGELHPAVRERLELNVKRAVAAELNLELLMTLAQPSRYTPISRFPATVQDLSFVVANDVSAERVAELIRRGAGELLESLTLFDVYTGAQVGEGKRSLTYKLAFRAADRTLSDEALAKVRQKIIKLLEREAGASIRA
jgi:phenylalanyl-tRNA synthetase beta chain